MREVKVGGARLQLVVGDITAQDTEAVVNAANSRLATGGGVAGAIHRAAGPGLWEECRTLGGCPTGEARISGGHDLPNRWVIHTVGPVYGGGEQDAVQLKSCYEQSLRLVSERGIRSVAFPALSTGIFGYPLREAAQVALTTILSCLKKHPDIELVRMVLYDDEAFAVHGAVLDTMNLEET